jgi:hypothetical protein
LVNFSVKKLRENEYPRRCPINPYVFIFNNFKPPPNLPQRVRLKKGNVFILLIIILSGSKFLSHGNLILKRIFNFEPQILIHSISIIRIVPEPPLLEGVWGRL